MVVPPLTDRAAGAVTAALLCTLSDDAVERAVPEAAAALAALRAAPAADRDAWLVATVCRLLAVPAERMDHVHRSWIAAALAADPEGRSIAGNRRAARDLLGRLPSPGPLPAPLAAIAPAGLEAVVRALGARRLAIAFLPAGRTALVQAAARLPARDAALVLAAANAGPARADEDARQAIAEVREAFAAGTGVLLALGAGRLARALATAGAAIERAAAALPMDAGATLARRAREADRAPVPGDPLPPGELDLARRLAERTERS